MRRTTQSFSAGRIAVFAALLALGLFAALFPARSAGVDVSEGKPAPDTVRSPKDIAYESDVLGQRQRDEAAAAIAPTLVFDPNARARQVQRLDDALNSITIIRASTSLDATGKSAALTSIQGLQLTPRAAVLALAFTDDEWAIVHREARTQLAETMDATIAPDGTTRAREAQNQRIATRLGEGVGLLVREIAGAFIAPNQVVDEAATARARDAARAAVPPAKVSIARGDVVVRAGEQVDEAAIEKLRRLDLLHDDFAPADIAAVGLVAAVSAGTLGAYLSLTRPAGLAERRRLALLGLISVAFVATARLAIPQFLPDDDRLYLTYMLPLAAAPMIVAALLDAPVAAAVAALVATLAGFAAFYRPEASQVAASRPLDAVTLTTTVLFAGLAGAVVADRTDRMNRLLWAGAVVAATTIALLTAFWFLDPANDTEDFAWIAAAGLVAGAGAALVTAAAFAILSALFGVTTRMRLMELAQLDQPLLRRLRQESPGTFHHSIILSSLAERAADAVGADSLLVRVGCYYHDIGKTLRAHYYIENQGAGPNPHDRLDPVQSASIIIDHVRGGEELARRGGLPALVRAFITEHHGTRAVSYFYRKAAQRDPAVDQREFRYPGPKPQSRETAIVMLADSAEAVVRSSRDRSPERIDALVDGVIAERLGEGELDECDLTLRDIAAIAASFKATLRGVYHPRIEYPAPTTAEQQRAAEAARLLEAPAMPMDGVIAPPVER